MSQLVKNTNHDTIKKHMRDNQKKNMRRAIQVTLFVIIATLIIGVLVFVTYGHAVPVLQPKGLIANQERDLIVLTVGLGLVVVIPVFVMLFFIAWKYRASNTKAVYQPDFAGHRGIEALWWGIPIMIIIVLAVITTFATHALDPFRPIESSVKPIRIQVIALDWKWLFIYPDQGIATLNYLNIPNGTPVNLTITSDAPMNSFWVPALAGQVYAMSGMSTQLHMMADGSGSYKGASANISGKGFADMRFSVNSMSESDFMAWTKRAAASNNVLSADTYDMLSQPSQNNPDTMYRLNDSSLYNDTVMKYMSPGTSTDETMYGMNM
jgi:cytochrome o ubiquinol oxidase subunit 2